MDKKSSVAVLFTAFIVIAALGCVSPENNKVTVSGSTTVLPLIVAASEKFNAADNGFQVSVMGGGTGAGINAIFEKRSDIAMASREVTPQEISKYGDKFRQFDIGYDGIVLIVSKAVYDAGVKELSVDQIKKIYDGVISNWRDVGGPDQEIYVISREAGSGTRDTFNEDVMGNKSAVTSGVRTVAIGSAEIKTAVIGSDKAIGYVGFSYAGGDTIGVVKLEGVTPTVENIKDGSYKLHRHLYLYTFGEPTANSQKFINYTQSAEGQSIARENGFIPFSS